WVRGARSDRRTECRNAVGMPAPAEPPRAILSRSRSQTPGRGFPEERRGRAHVLVGRKYLQENLASRISETLQAWPVKSRSAPKAGTDSCSEAAGNLPRRRHDCE